MSFEGSYIFLCANGHRSDRDAYDAVEYFCGVCGEPIVWQYLVDCTNCSGVAPVFQQLDYDEDEDDEWRMLRYAVPSNAELGTVDLSKLNVPMAHVWFLDNDSGNVFPTEEAAWEYKATRLADVLSRDLSTP